MVEGPSGAQPAPDSSTDIFADVQYSPDPIPVVGSTTVHIPEELAREMGIVTAIDQIAKDFVVEALSTAATMKRKEKELLLRDYTKKQLYRMVEKIKDLMLLRVRKQVETETGNRVKRLEEQLVEATISDHLIDAQKSPNTLLSIAASLKQMEDALTKMNQSAQLRPAIQSLKDLQQFLQAVSVHVRYDGV